MRSLVTMEDYTVFKRMSTCVALLVFIDGSFAWGQRPRQPTGNGDAVTGSISIPSLKDIEGVVWEFKVIDAKSKKTTSTGRIRIKEDALFLVAMKEVGKQDGDAAPPKGPFGPLAQIGKKIESVVSNDPTERVGDFDQEHYTESGEVRLNFDTDDNYELSGRAFVKRNSPKASIWSGYYDDTDKKRWKFELRKIEE